MNRSNGHPNILNELRASLLYPLTYFLLNLLSTSIAANRLNDNVLSMSFAMIGADVLSSCWEPIHCIMPLN